MSVTKYCPPNFHVLPFLLSLLGLPVGVTRYLARGGHGQEALCVDVAHVALVHPQVEAAFLLGVLSEAHELQEVPHQSPRVDSKQRY